MFLADTTTTTTMTATVTTLDGITTVLTAFMFVCLVLPTMVRHRSQFYAALACIAGIIVIHTGMLMFGAFTFGPVAIGFLQLMALLLLVLCVGGLTVRELAGDMAKAYEVIRRGETEKEIIIPLGDRPPPGLGKKGRGEDAPRQVYTINNPSPIIDPDDDTEDKGIPFSK
jgi:hypothetical protein